jgi:hypothetical protein
MVGDEEMTIGFRDDGMDSTRRRIIEYYYPQSVYWPTINNFLQGRILADLSPLQVSQLHANLVRKELRDRPMRGSDNATG